MMKHKYHKLEWIGDIKTLQILKFPSHGCNRSEVAKVYFEAVTFPNTEAHEASLRANGWAEPRKPTKLERFFSAFGSSPHAFASIPGPQGASSAGAASHRTLLPQRQHTPSTSSSHHSPAEMSQQSLG